MWNGVACPHTSASDLITRNTLIQHGDTVHLHCCALNVCPGNIGNARASSLGASSSCSSANCIHHMLATAELAHVSRRVSLTEFRGFLQH